MVRNSHLLHDQIAVTICPIAVFDVESCPMCGRFTLESIAAHNAANVTIDIAADVAAYVAAHIAALHR